MENVVETILISMSSVTKPQLLFMMNLFSVLVVFQGKATFRNLSRYCEMHKKRFSRWYRRHFDFALFNLCLVDHELEKRAERIAAIDAKQTIDTACETRVDFYARQVTELATSLKDQNISYLVADAYYSKVKFIDAVCSSHLDMIGKLRY